MKCAYCSNIATKVIDKRENIENDVVRRRRECLKCKKRFTTYEEVGSLDIVVLKKDGSKEEFKRDKLLQGIKIACEKRSIQEKQIIKIVDNIEKVLREKKGTEIKSSDIGKMVLKNLRNIDKVAYMRFAAVYYSFEDLKRFEKEIKSIK